MINSSLRLTAGFLASVLLITTIPADALVVEGTEETTYISIEDYNFSSGAISAITETVVLDTDDDDSILVDGEAGVTDNDTPVVSEPDETPEVPEETPEAPVDLFANIAIANKVSTYLNVRVEPNAESELVGKIYKNNAAIVLENLGDWYKIKSGNLTGYIASKYVTVGDEALCKSVASMTATITTNTLRLRKNPSTSAGVYTLLGTGQKVTVLADNGDGWLQIKYKSYTGYISADYADVTMTYSYGETLEEEKARIAAEKAAEAAAKKKAEEEKKKQEAANKTYKDPTGSDGQAVVDYALQFLGNPYVWGGSSLTKGVDCSGFVMKVYEKFGYKLPHSSYKLRSVGKKVSASDLQPGDIICYSGHVGIYIGNGKIVHASNKKDGIKITNNYNYRKVITIRRVL